MPRLTAAILTLALLIGCSSGPDKSSSSTSLANPNTPTDGSNAAPTGPIATEPSAVVASVNGTPIRVADIYRPMMEAYGLQFMLHLTQLEIAKQKAAALSISISPADIAQERKRTIEQLFKDNAVDIDKVPGSDAEKNAYATKEYERLLDQFLSMQRISKPEFNILMETLANLHKIAEIQVKDKISDSEVEAAFKIKYGEKVKVRLIQLRNRTDAAVALRRLYEEKQPFEKVAKDMSLHEESRPYGGAIRPFSRAEILWPIAFKEVAFSLKTPGEISEQINIGDATYILMLEARIPPNAAVKFEDHREFVRQELYELMAQMRVKQLRDDIAIEAAKSLKIQDPVLKRQYDDRMARTIGEVPKTRDEINKEIQRDHASTQPATQPSKGPEVARPPATRPGH